MNGRRRDGHRPRVGHSEDEFFRRWTGNPSGGRPAPRMLRPISWIVAIIGLAVWSLLAWIGYALADPVLGWVAANAGLLVDGGKNLANATGVGKEVGSVVDALDVSGLLGQAIALLRVVLKPVIVVAWAIGALALAAAPWVLPKIGRLLAAHRH